MAAKAKQKPAESTPPVLVVSGDEVYLRRQFLDSVVGKKRAEGWRVIEVEGTDKAGLRAALDDNPFLSGMTLAVVEHPKQVDPDLLKRHMADQDPTTVLLLHFDGNPDYRTKLGKLVKEALAPHHKTFEAPKPYKAPEVAAAFVLAEVKQYGLTIEEKLVPAFVSRVGTSLGLLHFEVLKMAMLAQSQGVKVIGSDQIKGAMASLAEASVIPIAEALVARSQPRLYKALHHLYRTSKDDPTMKVCGFLGAAVQRWLGAAYLDPTMSVQQAAAEIRQSPWEYQRLTLPGAQAWGRAGTVELVQTLARAERAVLQGAHNPGLVLISGLLLACQKAQAHGR
jgi:DNA polymerase III delta subunit